MLNFGVSQLSKLDVLYSMYISVQKSAPGEVMRK